MQGRIARCVVFSASALTVVSLSSVCLYLTHRAQDSAEIVDIGFTASLKPGFALYGDGVSVLPLGISYVDGYFLGWGGGQIGATRHCEKCWGMLAIGHEKHAWGEFNKDDPSTYSEVRGRSGGADLSPG